MDACKYGVSTVHITMAFGYDANALARLATWGMLLEASSKKNVGDKLTLTYVESTCRGNPQQYCRINYWLVAGGVMLHQVSRRFDRC